MPNPLDGITSTSDQDAYYSGLSEHYDRLLMQDQFIIESLPINFIGQQGIYNLLMTIRTMQRYGDMTGTFTLPIGLAEAIFITLGHQAVLVLIRSWGYAGNYDWRSMLGFLQGVERMERDKLAQATLNNAPMPEGDDQDGD